MNRSLSIRSGGKSRSSGSKGQRTGGFSFNSLRGNIQPELSRRLYRVIKSENNLIQAHETAGRERQNIASQLSEWGEHTNDEAVNDISDKIGVVLSEIGELEDSYAHALDDSRAHLKSIRNTEKSVQPSRDGKDKIADDIAKLKMKEPESAKLVVLEQELVRAEAENLVAEAQLTNMTREKLKAAYEAEFAATIERAEKQILLAKHGRRLLHLLDDAPVAPGDARRSYPHAQQARQILNDCEDDLRDWQPQPDEFGIEPPQGETLSQGNALFRHGTNGSGSLLSDDGSRPVKGKDRALGTDNQSLTEQDLQSETADNTALNGGEVDEASQIRA